MNGLKIIPLATPVTTAYFLHLLRTPIALPKEPLMLPITA
jgi:hypothetical protein